MRTSMDMLNGSLWDKILKFSMPVAATAILEQFFYRYRRSNCRQLC